MRGATIVAVSHENRDTSGFPLLRSFVAASATRPTPLSFLLTLIHRVFLSNRTFCAVLQFVVNANDVLSHLDESGTDYVGIGIELTTNRRSLVYGKRAHLGKVVDQAKTSICNPARCCCVRRDCMKPDLRRSGARTKCNAIISVVDGAPTPKGMMASCPSHKNPANTRIDKRKTLYLDGWCSTAAPFFWR